MNKKIDISIIVPVYNAEKTIEKCFNSLESQTLEEIEILFIDDGSHDKSYQILERLCMNSTKARVVTQKNGGPSRARNHGIDLSQGKYIMFCDSDDIVESDWCRSLLEAAEKYDCMTLCHMRRERPSGEKLWDSIENFPYSSNIVLMPLSKMDCIYKSQLLNSPCNKIYRKSIIDDFRIRFDESISLGEDLLFNLAYLQNVQVKQVCVIKQALYHYIASNAESLTGKYHDDYIEAQHKIFTDLISFSERTHAQSSFIDSLYYDYFYLVYNFFDEYIKNNSKPFYDKVRYLTKIMKQDDLFNEALQRCKFENDSPILIRTVKRRNFFLIWILNKGCGAIQWIKGK